MADKVPNAQSSPPISLALSACKSRGSNKSKASHHSTRPSSPDIWGIQLVSRAYRNVPYAPVDPWKPSLLYSIRHIHPDTASPVGTPLASSRLEHDYMHTPSPRSAFQIVDESRVLDELHEYPFSPRDSRVTAKPVRFTPKNPARRTQGSRYFWPYPSPTDVPPRTASINAHAHPENWPWQRDRFERPSNTPTLDNADVPSSSPSLYNFPPPKGPALGLHSRGTSGSQTIAEGLDHQSTLPGNSGILQSQNENQGGTTVMIAPNHQYLRPIPKLERPPGPRSRSGTVVPPQRPESPKSISKSINSKSSSMKGPQNSFATKTYIFAFLLDTLPRQIYLYFLLCLPYMYFSRVAHIFEAAELSLPKIKQGVIEFAKQEHQHSSGTPHNWRFGPPVPNAAYLDLQRTWELFIESLMREWRTLNIISVLLLSAILAILQIESAINDPVTVYSALLSMMCALMSLIYGCIYIIRFGSMRKVSKAAIWAAEAQRSTTCILWNVWVFLAMPAAWLAWSMVLYIGCVMSLVWRTGSADDPKTWTLTSSQALFPRTIITAVLGLGLIYFALILNTLRRYGHTMDRAWKKLATGWIQNKRSPSLLNKQSQLPSLRHGPSPFKPSFNASPSKSCESSEQKSMTHDEM